VGAVTTAYIFQKIGFKVLAVNYEIPELPGDLPSIVRDVF
jgi:hypothetical protein